MEVRTRIGKNGRMEERRRRVIGCVLVDRKKEVLIYFAQVKV